MKCPRCGEEVSLEYGSGARHLRDCELFTLSDEDNIIGCVCGLEFGDGGSLGERWTRHCTAIAHDWDKIMVRKELESM